MVKGMPSLSSQLVLQLRIIRSTMIKAVSGWRRERIWGYAATGRGGDARSGALG